MNKLPLIVRNLDNKTFHNAFVELFKGTVFFVCLSQLDFNKYFFHDPITFILTLRIRFLFALSYNNYFELVKFIL